MRAKAPLPTFLLVLALAAPGLARAEEPAAQADEPAAAAPDEASGEKRLDDVEKKVARDRLNFTGEIRVANDFIRGTQPAHFDGMALQKSIVDTLFYVRTNGAMPGFGSGAGAGALSGSAAGQPQPSLASVLQSNIAAHYSDYLYFLSQLSFRDLQAAMASFPPEMRQALMQMLLPGAARAARDYDNSILYTTRLRLNMGADINEHLSFAGRLSMYKTWGDSAGVQVFNGAPTSMNIDGTSTSVPNSDAIRVDRAYFDWKRIADTGLYLSVGRRPSSSGPPLEIRDNRLRGGTPLGHVVDFQFDGVTAGYVFDSEKVPGLIVRFCYGLGYESGFGSGAELRAPADRLQDVHFGGLNLDLYSTDRMFVQATALRAWRVTDGFNGLVVMPVDPVSGNPAPGPAVMRYTPSANLGDIDLAALLVERHDGPLHAFASLAGMKTHPNGTTTPFGGLLSDPFSVPESHTAWSAYAGVRWDVAKTSTQLGFEYNHGSQYWFNFTQAADDIVGSKLSTRGNAYEAYLSQVIGRNLALRLSGIKYDNEYSGSGWHVGEPKRLDSMPILGFPTYSDVWNVRLAATVRF
ncbi:MAG TPA: DUF3373 family protein [Vicinamibacteria bacterium]|nr:DUF3373 family protein [Vicinamibacteria bacterium]